MSLYSSSLLRAIRRRVRTELKASPALWKEHRSKRHLAGYTMDPAWLVYIVPAFLVLGSLASTPATGIAVLALVAWAGALYRSSQMTQYRSQDLLTLDDLPISDLEIARRHWRRLRNLSVLGMGLNGVFLVYFSDCAGLPIAATPGIVALAMPLWWGSEGAAAALRVWLPGRWRVPTALALVVFAAALVWSWIAIPRGQEQAAMTASVAALGALALAGFLRRPAFRRLEAAFIPNQIYLPFSRAEAAIQSRVDRGLVEAGVPEIGVAALRPRAMALVVPEQEARVRRGDFLSPMDWSRLRPLERLFGQLVSPRHRNVAEFLFGGGPTWSASLAGGAAFALLAAGAALLLPTFVHLLLAAFAILGLAGGRLPGLSGLAGARLRIASALPLSGAEMLSVVTRANLLHSLALAPFLLPYVFVLARHELGDGPSALLAAKIALMVVAAQPAVAAIRLLFRLDDATGGTALQITTQGMMKLFVAVLFLGVAFAAVVLFVVSATAPITLAAGVVIVGAPALSALLCARAYDHGWID